MSVIFCDSNCELWYDILEKNDVKLIKMPYSLDGAEYFYDCGKDTDFTYFYKRVREKSLPTTAALNTFNYIEIFEPYFIKGEDILYIAFSSQMSATFIYLDAAIKELKLKYPKVEFARFDTLNISVGAGIIVYNAIKLKQSGYSNSEILKELPKLREKAGIYFIVDDLYHLKRGGRLSASAAVIGSLLNIKPLLSVENGKLVSSKKIKGRKLAIEELITKLENEWDKNYKEVWLIEADCKNDLEYFKNKLKEKYRDGITLMCQSVGPVVGTHCGPDTLGIAFMKKI